jgi:hypothetical protein
VANAAPACALGLRPQASTATQLRIGAARQPEFVEQRRQRRYPRQPRRDEGQRRTVTALAHGATRGARSARSDDQRL